MSPQSLQTNSVTTSQDVWLGFRARPGRSLKASFFSLPSSQDVSGAGNQAGMEGTRTVLIKEIFRLWDEKDRSGYPLNLELF